MNLPLIGRKDAVLDGITGFVEHYDFSTANTSYEARVHTVTKVASICYQSPKALNSVSLFNRLQAEAAGLPSSSYEFVPVLLKLDSRWLCPRCEPLANANDVTHYHKVLHLQFAHSFKYGETVCDSNDDAYLLTNLRALIEDVGPEESLNYLNTSDKEIQIIRDNFKVFLFNVDIPTRTQMIRHRVSWQELSRRYVSGKKKAFDFYVSKKMKSLSCNTSSELNPFGKSVETDQLISLCVAHYDAAIANGVKPEEARRILPQAMLTTIWGAFQPKQLESYFKLRLDKHAQKEIRQVSQAMKELINAEQPNSSQNQKPQPSSDVTPSYYGAKCKCGAKLDPYVICDAYATPNKGSAWHHATKKLLRAGEGHKPLEKDIKEVIDTLNRWLEQLQTQDTQ